MDTKDMESSSLDIYFSDGKDEKSKFIRLYQYDVTFGDISVEGSLTLSLNMYDVCMANLRDNDYFVRAINVHSKNVMIENPYPSKRYLKVTLNKVRFYKVAKETQVVVHFTAA